MNIAEVVPKDNFQLYMRADDGTSGLFDVTPYLDSDAFLPLKDKQQFERIHNRGYFVEWDCGADLSADTLMARWKVVSKTNA